MEAALGNRRRISRAARSMRARQRITIVASWIARLVLTLPVALAAGCIERSTLPTGVPEQDVPERTHAAKNLTRIAFASDRDGNYEIYIMDADGTGVTRLTNSPADDFLPAWSPRKQIAFASSRSGANYEIYIMNADGTGLTNLTNHTSDDREQIGRASCRERV